MNLDPKNSAMPCGCDPGIGAECAWHRENRALARIVELEEIIETQHAFITALLRMFPIPVA